MSLPAHSLSLTSHLRPLSVLALALSMHPLEAGISVLDSSVTYDGLIHWPELRFDGTARPLTHASRSVVDGESFEVFSNIPATLNLSYTSLSFSASRTTMLGNLVNLSGSQRVANHVEAVLVTWATAAQYPAWAAEDPSGYTHPVTTRLYQLEMNGASTVLRELESLKLHAHIPWRPTFLPDGSPYPYNGYAFKLILPLSGQVSVPGAVIVALSYDTQTAGLNPIGIPGPYNELNVGLSGLKSRIGTDPDTASVFWVKDGVWSYPSSNWGAVGSPMLGLHARQVALPAPALSAASPPRHAGFHHVRSSLTDGTQIDSLQTISKAPATIRVTDTDKSVSDSDLSPVAITTPAGLPYRITYNGAGTPPNTPGNHPFQVVIESPDHEGSASGLLHLSAPRYEQWAESMLPLSPQSSGALQDPDQDGLHNIFEYATGSAPSVQDAPAMLTRDGNQSVFTFRQRKEMPEVWLEVETSDDLRSWSVATTEIVNSDSFWETRRVRSEKKSTFFRLKAGSQ